SIVVRHAGTHRGEVAAVVAISGPSRWYYRGTGPMRRGHWVIERRIGRLGSRGAPRTRLDPNGWPGVPEAPHEVVGRISPVPLLVVHGDADHYFPAEHGERLYEAAAEPKRLWLESGFGHAENAASDELLGRIRDWVVHAARTGRA